MAHYEKWILPLLSNDRIMFYSANRAMNRIDKTRLISEYKISYDNLLVSWTGVSNCGECSKCIRTQATLDLLGVIDRYEGSFDLEKYKKNRKKFFCEIAARRKKDPYYEEIYNELLSKTDERPTGYRIIVWRGKHYADRMRHYGIKGTIEKIVRNLKK